MRGQLVVISTAMARRRPGKFCWYFKFWSVVTKASKPAASALVSRSPFLSSCQASSRVVVISCFGKYSRSGARVPWSKRMRTHATCSEAAACSSTTRTCTVLTPGNHCTKSATCAPSSRFSKRAATGTRVPRNTQAPLTRSGLRSTAGQVLQSIMLRAYPYGAQPSNAGKAWLYVSTILATRSRSSAARSMSFFRMSVLRGLVCCALLISRARTICSRPTPLSP